MWLAKYTQFESIWEENWLDFTEYMSVGNQVFSKIQRFQLLLAYLSLIRKNCSC